MALFPDDSTDVATSGIALICIEHVISPFQQIVLSAPHPEYKSVQPAEYRMFILELVVSTQMPVQAAKNVTYICALVAVRQDRQEFITAKFWPRHSIQRVASLQLFTKYFEYVVSYSMVTPVIVNLLKVIQVEGNHRQWTACAADIVAILILQPLHDISAVKHICGPGPRTAILLRDCPQILRRIPD